MNKEEIMTYYKTIVKIEILSNFPYTGQETLQEIVHDITEGDCSGVWNFASQKELTEQQMKRALIRQGSDPSFLIPKEEDTMSKKKTKQLEDVPCTFVSVWDGGIVLRSKAIYNPNTKEVEVLETFDVDGLEVLEDEYIEFEDGDTKEVCRECHMGILESKMEESKVDRKDKTLYEIVRCPICDTQFVDCPRKE
jgi:hypothetical protein